MRTPLVLAALFLSAVLTAPAVRAEQLVMSLSSSRVQITSTYTGAELMLFGVVERDTATVSRAGDFDIVVTAAGPRSPVIVRQKRRLGPIWVNRSQRRFVDIPSALLVLANRPLRDITSPGLQRRLRLGIEPVIQEAQGWQASTDEIRAEFRAGLIRLKTQSGLFVENDTGVEFLSPGIFRAVLPIPATAPPGTWQVEVSLLSGGVELVRKQTGFEVGKAGFEQVLTQAAHDQPMIYGLATAGMALAFGWIASVIFRRD